MIYTSLARIRLRAEWVKWMTTVTVTVTAPFQLSLSIRTRASAQEEHSHPPQRLDLPRRSLQSRMIRRGSTASARVFAIREVFDIILHGLTHAELAACGRVNRTWELPSLALLWRDLQDPRPLFELLGELIEEDNILVSCFLPHDPLLPISSSHMTSPSIERKSQLLKNGLAIIDMRPLFGMRHYGSPPALGLPQEFTFHPV